METEPDEWEVEAILRHREGKDGQWEFLTKWVGSPPGEETWEPLHSFIMKYCVVAIQYMQERGLRADVARSLSGTEGVRDLGRGGRGTC